MIKIKAPKIDPINLKLTTWEKYFDNKLIKNASHSNVYLINNKSVITKLLKSGYKSYAWKQIKTQSY